MRTTGAMKAAMAVAAAGFAQVTLTQPTVDCDVTVTGQNNAATDVGLVASALQVVTEGDVTVCLAGVFDFGEPAAGTFMSVAINPPPAVTSLRIVGLDDEQGRPARIRNGIQALSFAAASTLPRLSIENLRFVGPTFSAISIFRSNESVSVSNVHIAGVRSFSLAPTLRVRNGISITPALGGTFEGDIAIVDNVVNGGRYDAEDHALSASAGIQIVGSLTDAPNPTFNARVRVADNRFVNWSGTGILAAGLGDLTIEQNNIAPGAFANFLPGCTNAANGSGAASGISLAGVSNSLVRDNAINLEPAFTSTGDPAACTGGVILTGALAGGSHNNVFYRNRIRGTGSYALMVGRSLVPGDPSAELDNVFALNPVANFTSTAATLFLGPGAAGNVLIGDFAAVEDESGGVNTIVAQ